MKTITAALLCALTLTGPTNAFAQEDPTERARRILAEAEAHHEAGREALAAEGYLRLYEALREIGRAQAPVALWNAGNALTDVPGRERDAITTLRRFLDESTVLTDNPQVVAWRSTAVGLIAELEARVPSSGQDLGEPDESAAEESSEPPAPEGADGRSISPVGPVLLGVGGAALVAGLIVAGLLATENDAFFAMCVDDVCPDSARPAAENVQTLASVTDALLIGGSVLAATGFLLTLLLHDDAEPPVTAGCGPDRCDVRVRGTF